VTLPEWHGQLAYLAVFVAAALEGEVVFVTASVLVGRGHLDPWWTLLAGALGGSAGDQFFFYALRGRLRRWLERFPRVAHYKENVTARVIRHAVPMILACRFLPGLRIAIPAACAYAGVPAAKFTALNLLGAVAWAASIMAFVAWGGPAVAGLFGLHGWWPLIVPAVLLVVFFRWLGAKR
jgi:membrane protein DedA with SNARE-associated domain